MILETYNLLALVGVGDRVFKDAMSHVINLFTFVTSPLHFHYRSYRMATAEEDFSQFDISTEVHTGPHLHVYFSDFAG